MANSARSEPLATEQTTLTPTDRYESTFVVSPDPAKGDFTTLQDAINALPPTGGKVFVKAGVYPITSTIQITTSNVHIQGEGMGITVFRAVSTMTGNTPGSEVRALDKPHCGPESTGAGQSREIEARDGGFESG